MKKKINEIFRVFWFNVGFSQLIFNILWPAFVIPVLNLVLKQSVETMLVSYILCVLLLMLDSFVKYGLIYPKKMKKTFKKSVEMLSSVDGVKNIKINWPGLYFWDIDELNKISDQVLTNSDCIIKIFESNGRLVTEVVKDNKGTVL